MSESESKRVPGEPEMTQTEIHSFVRRVQNDLYFGPDNLRVVLARMDERLRNTATSMDERLGNTAASIDERLRNMDASIDERFRNMDASIDERFRNMDARMDERLRNTATTEDIANLKISMIRWFLGSGLTLAGIIVTVFKWLQP